jgi:glycerol-3-phosphate dehydrogenase
MIHEYDIIIFGGGIAGLWIGNTLKRARYNVILIEKEKLGAGQTLASQGMIHGGQKYVLQGVMTPHAAAAARMPQRWQAGFEGRGEVDLTGVRFLSETQIMWPAGSLVSAAAVLAAATLVNADCRRLKQTDYPEALRKRKFNGPVYSLPEKVVDVRSVIAALSQSLEGAILKGEITGITADGEVAVSGERLRAQLVIFAAGAGNERALEMLNVAERLTQRRPLRQVMIRPLPYALYAHGIANNGRPRISVTSHANGHGEYVWYLGGAVAETGANMDAAAALRFARQELDQIFPELDWSGREWATWYGDRAEPLDARGELPVGPFVRQYGRILVVWPTKLTFVPALADRVFERLNGMDPGAGSPPPPLPRAEIGPYPWEIAEWQKIA